MSRISLINRIETLGKFYKTLGLLTDIDSMTIDLYSGSTVNYFNNSIAYLSGQTNSKVNKTTYAAYTGTTNSVLKNKLSIISYSDDGNRPDFPTIAWLYFNEARQCDEYWNGSSWIQLLPSITVQQFNSYTGNTINTPQTIITGSTSGTTIFCQPESGISHKSILIYCNSLLGTATYEFPTPFTYIPDKLGSNISLITSLNTTAVTVSGNTSSGFIKLYGF